MSPETISPESPAVEGVTKDELLDAAQRAGVATEILSIIARSRVDGQEGSRVTDLDYFLTGAATFSRQFPEAMSVADEVARDAENASDIRQFAEMHWIDYPPEQTGEWKFFRDALEQLKKVEEKYEPEENLGGSGTTENIQEESLTSDAARNPTDARPNRRIRHPVAPKANEVQMDSDGSTESGDVDRGQLAERHLRELLSWLLLRARVERRRPAARLRSVAALGAADQETIARAFAGLQQAANVPEGEARQTGGNDTSRHQPNRFRSLEDADSSGRDSMASASVEGRETKQFLADNPERHHELTKPEPDPGDAARLLLDRLPADASLLRIAAPEVPSGLVDQFTRMALRRSLRLPDLTPRLELPSLGQSADELVAELPAGRLSRTGPGEYLLAYRQPAGDDKVIAPPERTTDSPQLTNNYNEQRNLADDHRLPGVRTAGADRHPSRHELDSCGADKRYRQVPDGSDGPDSLAVSEDPAADRRSRFFADSGPDYNPSAAEHATQLARLSERTAADSILNQADFRGTADDADQVIRRHPARYRHGAGSGRPDKPRRARLTGRAPGSCEVTADDRAWLLQPTEATGCFDETANAPS